MKPILGITMGDAAGVGPEIIIKALTDTHIYDIARPIVFGDKKIMERAIGLLHSKLTCNSVQNPQQGYFRYGTIDIVDLDNLPADLPFAKVDARAGKAAYEYIEKAMQFALKQDIHAIVTAPLNKEALNLSGCNYPGHTEILGALSGEKDYSMMLVSGSLKVIHVTTHVALREACDLVKKERVLKVIKLADETLKLMGIEKPRIAVAGLNPHCGEHGLFGTEDELEIVPAIKLAQQAGINAIGPMPPDSVFHRAANLGEFDIVVVMYHDQGHIPIKVLGFESGVNVTVGLPIIRTSVDHGTAFPVAGEGIADSKSMTESLILGAKMANVKFADFLNKE
ncbi:4-hydroxythreonine-4-phosphate dehydrogenase PdxA [Propionispira raffinosivorans]|uniref:4-hydroxythreonine-4-phosphate dehydrogenase PdxA n=1 Tax=Propionispira raffinosivorans TaxID=86959 RepID=UPI0003827C68|nr:4-hydroxythreonine-4-phosphate dehydrogenase PdxA [Propionispira raffinosivorans]